MRGENPQSPQVWGEAGARHDNALPHGPALAAHAYPLQRIRELDVQPEALLARAGKKRRSNGRSPVRILVGEDEHARPGCGVLDGFGRSVETRRSSRRTADGGVQIIAGRTTEHERHGWSPVCGQG